MKILCVEHDKHGSHPPVKRVKNTAGFSEEELSRTINTVALKTRFNPELAKALLLTKTAELIEGNTWGDKIWGQCNGVGANLLGKILMDIRSGLQTLYSRNGKYIFFED